MGCIFSKIMKDSSNIEVLDYDYLRLRGTIIIEMDNKWNVLVILFDFNGWTQNVVRLWPENNTQRENFLLLERTPLSSPNVSSTSIDSSAYDTAFKLSKNNDALSSV